MTMATAKRTFTTVKEYESVLPVHSRRMLKTIRKAIAAAVPGIEETISYNIPTFKYEGRIIVSVGVWKDHVGLYPAPNGSATFNKAIAKHRGTKSSAHFGLDEPLPLNLIVQCVKLRLKKTTKDRETWSA